MSAHLPLLISIVGCTDIPRAAELLGINPSTLRSRMRKLGAGQRFGIYLKAAETDENIAESAGSVRWNKTAGEEWVGIVEHECGYSVCHVCGYPKCA